MLRLFVGIELPPKIQQELSSVATGSQLKAARWINPENLHLTLKFLGNCPEAKEEEIITVLKKSTAGTQSFSFNLNGLGGFPSEKRARIIWAGLSSAQEEIASLQKKVEDSLSKIGFRKEKRPFHSHITLARLKIPQDIRPLIASADISSFDNESVAVDKVILFESHLKRIGAVYTQRLQIPLD